MTEAYFKQLFIYGMLLEAMGGPDADDLYEEDGWVWEQQETINDGRDEMMFAMLLRD